MTQWYVYHNDEVMGPYAFEDLAGKLTPDTHVCPAGEDSWYKAGDIDGFEPALQPEYRSDSGSNGSTTQSTGTQTDGQMGAGTTDGAGNQTGQQTQQTDDSDVSADDVEPTLDTLYTITQRANNDELLEEYNRHWNSYDAKEQKIIKNEIDRRGLEVS